MWTSRHLSLALRTRLQAPLASRQWTAIARSVSSNSSGGGGGGGNGYLTDVTFESVPISRTSKDVLTGAMGYEFLTNVQKETLPLVLDGRDVLAKGKTGNGKTMAFLLPAVERMLAGPTSSKISTLVISPTRELAQQIAVESVKLTNAHGLRTACFVGGSAVNKDVKELTRAGTIDVLVATPGRLKGYLEDDTGRIRQKLSELQVLVLDEADRLLDMGFRPDIMQIISQLPSKRQTLLFSATLPTATEELKNVALRDDYAFVDTVGDDDEQTNAQAVQEYLVCDLQDVIPAVEGVLEEHMKLPKYKVIVFLPTARATQFMAQLFQAAGFKGVLEMHSRKSQSARTKAANAFRKGRQVIMFSSDVSARGVDYPDVSLVLQVGLTDRDQYIHRLGRTARAGMEGRGVLVLADFEKALLRDLADLPLTELPQRPQLDAGSYRTTRTLAKMRSGSELEASAEKAYQAWLGFYNSNLKVLGMDKKELVQTGALYSQIIGLKEVPLLQKKTLRAMGLLDTPGITAAAKAPRTGGSKKKGRGEFPKGGIVEGYQNNFGTEPRRESKIDRFASHLGYEGRKKPTRKYDSPTRTQPNRMERRAIQRLTSQEGDARGGRSDRGQTLWRTFEDDESKSKFKDSRGRRSASVDGEHSRRGRGGRGGPKRSASTASKRNYKEPHKRY